MHRVPQWTHKGLCLEVIAISEACSDHEGHVGRPIADQCGKSGQSGYEMGCTSLACNLIQSLCRLLLKLPLQDAVARIDTNGTCGPLLRLSDSQLWSWTNTLPPKIGRAHV